MLEGTPAMSVGQPVFTIGTPVQWTSSGQDQFTTPRTINSFVEHSGKRFALLDGEKTGVPVDELRPWDEPPAPPNPPAPSPPPSSPEKEKTPTPSDPQNLQNTGFEGFEGDQTHTNPKILAAHPPAPGLDPADPPDQNALAWHNNAENLTSFVFDRLAVRTTAYGRYTGDGRQFTAKDTLTREVVKRHFLGQKASDIIGLHTTFAEAIPGPDGQEIISCTSRWCCTDIDWHGEGPAPVTNFDAALTWHLRLIDLGFRPLLVDSNGRGGYRNVIIFSDPTQTPLAYHLMRWLIQDWKEQGLDSEPEAFPKQPAIVLNGYGNWIRWLMSGNWWRI